MLTTTEKLFCALTGAGSGDLGFLEEIIDNQELCVYDICEYVRDELDYKPDAQSTINPFVYASFELIRSRWESYISSELGEPITLELDFFINCIDSHIDSGASGYDLHWMDSNEEALAKYKAKLAEDKSE